MAVKQEADQGMIERQDTIDGESKPAKCEERYDPGKNSSKVPPTKRRKATFKSIKQKKESLSLEMKSDPDLTLTITKKSLPKKGTISTGGKWTAEEDKLLIDCILGLVQTIPWQEFVDRFPNRDVKSLQNSFAGLPSILIYGDSLKERAFETPLCIIQERIAGFFYYQFLIFPAVLSFYLWYALVKNDTEIENKCIRYVSSTIWLYGAAYHFGEWLGVRNEKNWGVQANRLTCVTNSSGKYWIAWVIPDTIMTAVATFFACILLFMVFGTTHSAAIFLPCCYYAPHRKASISTNAGSFHQLEENSKDTVHSKGVLPKYDLIFIKQENQSRPKVLTIISEVLEEDEMSEKKNSNSYAYRTESTIQTLISSGRDSFEIVEIL
ncbi:hypothetical protein G9A89_001868 [Geosiphon pyriformis]|nr:hypothetical protein G9A89_001868 [Geosiphon pyriformis]